LTWEFIKEHWDELHKRYQGGFLLSRLVKVCLYICFVEFSLWRILCLLYSLCTKRKPWV